MVNMFSGKINRGFDMFDVWHCDITLIKINILEHKNQVIRMRLFVKA
jgi:hypothetical protein